jgi:fructose-bisphosphate aldolase class II
VRRVATGRAVEEDSRYRCCWIVEFTSEQVIASYRDDPDHVAFADELFRPIAPDRLSIDYALTGHG